MNDRPNVPIWIVIIKLAIVFVTADLAAYIVHKEQSAAFTGGLLVGVGLQALVPPRGGWKQNALIALIALAIGIVRSFFHG